MHIGAKKIIILVRIEIEELIILVRRNPRIKNIIHIDIEEE